MSEGPELRICLAGFQMPQDGVVKVPFLLNVSESPLYCPGSCLHISGSQCFIDCVKFSVFNYLAT